MTTYRSFVMARTSHMLALRAQGKTNYQIGKAVGLSATTVAKYIGNQTDTINKRSFKKRGRKAAYTRAKHNLEKVLSKKQAELDKLDSKIDAAKALRKMKADAIEAFKQNKYLKGRA